MSVSEIVARQPAVVELRVLASQRQIKAALAILVTVAGAHVATGLAEHGQDIAAALADIPASADLLAGTYANLEAQVAAIADDIAYNAHDIDDAVRAAQGYVREGRDWVVADGNYKHTRLHAIDVATKKETALTSKAPPGAVSR